MTRAQPCLGLLGRTFGMVCAEQSTTSSTVTTRDPPSPSRDRTAPLDEEPFDLDNRHHRGAATSTEDKVTEKLSKHQEEQEMSAKPQDNETPTVRERKKRDKTPSVSPQTKEEVPKSSPGGQKGTGSSSQSSQGNAEAESESSGGFWKILKKFCAKLLQLITAADEFLSSAKNLWDYLKKFFSQFK